MSDERFSYMKGVDANCIICRYWRRLDFCTFPGKLIIKNGFCLSLKARDDDLP